MLEFMLRIGFVEARLERNAGQPIRRPADVLALGSLREQHSLKIDVSVVRGVIAAVQSTQFVHAEQADALASPASAAAGEHLHGADCFDAYRQREDVLIRLIRLKRRACDQIDPFIAIGAADIGIPRLLLAVDGDGAFIALLQGILKRVQKLDVLLIRRIHIRDDEELDLALVACHGAGRHLKEIRCISRPHVHGQCQQDQRGQERKASEPPRG